MSRRIEHSASYSVAAARVHGALAERSYWQARIEEVGGPGAALNGFTEAGGDVRVDLTQAIPEEHLPSIVAKVKSGDLIISRTETWGSLDSGTATGSFSAVVAGTPIKLRGAHTLRGHSTSCSIRTTGEVQVSVPLIGGKLERIIADNITRLLALEQDFTEQWLTEHSRG